MVQTVQENILEILDVRFGTIPLALKEKVQGISDPVFLKTLLRQAIQIPSLEEFETFHVSILAYTQFL